MRSRRAPPPRPPPPRSPFDRCPWPPGRRSEPRGGPACHTGARSCFFESLGPDAPVAPGETLARLEEVLAARRTDAPPGSYTAKLYADENLRHKKVGEEATELVMASLRGDE